MISLATLRSTQAHAVIFECITGSRAYGTTTSESDEDVRGIFSVAARAYLELSRPPDQVADERGNTVYYSLRRVVELLTQANPNILELLFMPPDCVLKDTIEMRELTAHRQLFVTKQCAETHAGYAMSQIKKAKGQNKWINNPKPDAPPRKEDFCHVIPWAAHGEGIPPARPMPLNTLGWPLDEYHAARLEHARDTYRLYRYGTGARGVFRGDVIICESIPKDDEATKFAGLLLYNEAGWKQALADHKNYWSWRRERNEARWQQQERGELDFDAKNMMHTVRLLLSARSLMERGEPIVRFQDEQLALLMSIRTGKLTFDEIMSIAEAILADCERRKATADLPEVCDVAQASALLQTITGRWEDRQR